MALGARRAEWDIYTGIRTVRDGIRWHLIERTPGHYDFSSVLPMVRAAHDAGVQVIWDLCHYGLPDDLDIFSTGFVRRFAELARAFARLLTSETDAVPFVAPINEMSFFAWAGGEVAYFNPFVEGRAYELKAQLVRAAIAATEAVWEVHPGARIVHTDPVIHVHADPERPWDRPEAEAYTRSQYDSWDMLAGRHHPEVGGHPRYLDIVGVNYYPHNQWIFRDLPFNPEFCTPSSTSPGGMTDATCTTGCGTLRVNRESVRSTSPWRTSWPGSSGGSHGCAPGL